MSDSKEFWLNLRSKLTKYDVRMGTATGQSYIHDPKHLVFTASRYKFVAKMVAGCETVLEVGCGDAFGAPIVAQGVKRMICTDIDEEMLRDNNERCALFKNLEFQYHDFRAQPYRERMSAVYHVDVLEHLFPHEEEAFMTNLNASLTPNGIMVVGTPNITADQYASEHSRTGHVNLKDHRTLRSLCERYFHNVFLFSMNDEVLHTGFYPMAHYLWALCATRKEK